MIHSRLTARLLCDNALTSAFVMSLTLFAGGSALAETPVRGGTLTVASDTEPRNLNPAMIASNGVFYVSSKVVEPLAEQDYTTGLRPVLATAWRG